MAVVELHSHTCEYSGCAIDSTVDMLRAARTAGLDAIVITDHDHLYPERELVRRVDEAQVDGLVALAAQEVSTWDRSGWRGDFLVFGAPQAKGRMTPEELIEWAHAHGAVVVAAHPYRNGPRIGDQLYHLDVDGVEVINGSDPPEAVEPARAVAEERGLARTGGSDAHRAEQVGRCVTVFDGQVRSIADIVSGIRARRCSPRQGAHVVPGPVTRDLMRGLR
ncbi:MAG TPA: PHP domain-containing protein [Armatimonadota bacterium]|nr:PHP domain-containing protein [Armatimonadota bacterium]HQK94479.1 PHP domain-containing protein [Armatimonadota bacterium]